MAVCYRDMTFCADSRSGLCKVTKCARFFSAEDRQDAEIWWRGFNQGSGAPVSFQHFWDTCRKGNKNAKAGYAYGMRVNPFANDELVEEGPAQPRVQPGAINVGQDAQPVADGAIPIHWEVAAANNGARQWNAEGEAAPPPANADVNQINRGIGEAVINYRRRVHRFAHMNEDDHDF